ALTFGPDGSLYLADGLSGIFRKAPGGTLERWAGADRGTLSKDGNLETASFYGPIGLGFILGGDLLVAEEGGTSIRRVAATGNVSTLAGDNSRGEQDGIWTGASLVSPQTITFGTDGHLYMTDPTARLRRFSPT